MDMLWGQSIGEDVGSGRDNSRASRGRAVVECGPVIAKTFVEWSVGMVLSNLVKNEVTSRCGN